MKKVLIKIDKASVFREAQKHTNYITERNSDEVKYDMVRLYEEKHEMLEQAFSEGISTIVNATRAYDSCVKHNDYDAKITLTIPASHGTSLIASINREASAVCLYGVLHAWYSLVLPTEAEAQLTVQSLHLENMISLLDTRTSPKRKVVEDRASKVEIEY